MYRQVTGAEGAPSGQGWGVCVLCEKVIAFCDRAREAWLDGEVGGVGSRRKAAPTGGERERARGDVAGVENFRAAYDRTARTPGP